MGYPKQKGNYAVGWVDRRCAKCDADISFMARKRKVSTKTLCSNCISKKYKRGKYETKTYT
jgi:hypothetical protein